MIKKSRQAVGYSDDSLLTRYNTNRTMNPLNYDETIMSQIILENLRDFRTLIKYNVHNGMYLYKMNGDIVPMASHPFNLYDWKVKQKHIFESIGKWIDGERARLIIFPRESVRLGQVDDTDTLNDLAYLRYYVELMDVMRLDSSNKVVITIGKYADQKDGEERFVRNFYRLPKNIRSRLTLTNEPDGSRVHHLIDICHTIGIPFLLSYDKVHHKGSLKEKLNETYYEMNRSWKTQDGNPIIYLKDEPCNIEEEFYKLPSYDDLLHIDRRIYEHNLSVIYESSFKDIVAIKLTNCITQAKGVFLRKQCVDEWQRYRYLLMAHDPDAFVEMQSFMEEVSDFETFYKKVEQIMSRFKQIPNDLFAAEELLIDMSKHIKLSEKKKGMELLKAREMKVFKQYCHKLAEDYDLQDFISNYYFHLG